VTRHFTNHETFGEDSPVVEIKQQVNPNDPRYRREAPMTPKAVELVARKRIVYERLERTICSPKKLASCSPWTMETPSQMKTYMHNLFLRACHVANPLVLVKVLRIQRHIDPLQTDFRD
jgi:hypothetical protein